MQWLVTNDVVPSSIVNPGTSCFEGIVRSGLMLHGSMCYHPSIDGGISRQQQHGSLRTGWMLAISLLLHQNPLPFRISVILLMLDSKAVAR